MSPTLVSAHGTDLYQFKVSTGVLEQLVFGQNISDFRNRQISFLIKTDKELTISNVNVSTANAVIWGAYKNYSVNSDLQLEGVVEAGRIETKMTLGQMDTLLYEWEENYKELPFLKTLNQKTKKLSFHEGEGFSYTCGLSRNFNYLLAADIGYEASTHKLHDETQELRDIPRFIKAMEGDNRTRIILMNNKSGLPVYLAVLKEEGRVIYKARHPMHEIVWSRSKGFEYFFYQDAIEDVKTLPEIKRLMGVPEMKTFLSNQTGPVRVSVKGNLKEGFSFVVTSHDAGNKLTAKLINKKVVVGPLN